MNGWKWVPVEPTPEMAVEGARSLIDGQESRPGTSWADEARTAYRAMLNAAPSPAADAVSVDALMEMAQEYASAWSLVGGPFDRGDMLDEAEDAKERLRRAIAAAFAARGGR